jgi:hypothetical protein
MTLNTREYYNDDHQFSIGFSDVYDSVHLDQIVDIFRINISPDKIEKRYLYSGWHSSHIEYHISKDNIEFVISLDVYDIIWLTLKSENSPGAIELVRKWVNEVREAFL